MNKKNIGIYVHIPFCKKKCEYCDFKSYVGKENLIEKYVKCLKTEIRQVARKDKVDKLFSVKTIYIGGGTPSILENKYISEILDTIREEYIVAENAEVTIEVNPGTVDKDKLLGYKNSGINRLSIGLQDVHDNLLKTLGRIHTFKDFLSAYTLAKDAGFNNINVDLMLGIPNQSIKDLEESLSKIIKLNPKHISVYSLIVEEGTSFYEKWQSNSLKLPEDEIEREMYWLVKNKLENVGYIHYEISNFTKKGYESKHNLSCWNQEEYIGFGSAAHSYINNVRYSNIDTIEEYINNLESNNEINNLIFHERQDKESKMREFMILGLRKIKGIKISEFKNKFGENPIFKYREELKKLIDMELIEIDGDEIRLTYKGLDLANLVWEEFI